MQSLIHGLGPFGTTPHLYAPPRDLEDLLVLTEPLFEQDVDEGREQEVTREELLHLGSPPQRFTKPHLSNASEASKFQRYSIGCSWEAGMPQNYKAKERYSGHAG